jgi:hypothetical protein
LSVPRESNPISNKPQRHSYALRFYLDFFVACVAVVAVCHCLDAAIVSLGIEKRHDRDLRDKLPMVKRVDRDTADILRRTFAEETNHRALLTKMLMQSDPLAERP